MARIACIMVADFSIAAPVRSIPPSRASFWLSARTFAPHAELDAVSPRARELGIRPGMTIAQARAISSNLTVVHRSTAAESSAHSALLDAVESVSPVVESGAPGCVWLDLAGLHRIYNGEEEITAELVRCVRRVGMEPAAGVAANKELAHLAARCGGVRVIEAGREREFLDWLPLDMLELGKIGSRRRPGDHARQMGDAPARRAGAPQSRRGRHAAGPSRRRAGPPCARWKSMRRWCRAAAPSFSSRLSSLNTESRTWSRWDSSCVRCSSGSPSGFRCARWSPAISRSRSG